MQHLLFLYGLLPFPLATLDREVPVDDNIVSSSRGTGSGTVVPELQPHCTSPIQYL
jgi:hypothetical protein